MRIRVERLELTLGDTANDPKAFASEVGRSLFDEVNLRRDRLRAGQQIDLAVQVPGPTAPGQVAVAVAERLAGNGEEAP
jgi:hypothetical protein